MTFAFDRFRVNVATRECSRDGERVPLTGKTFDTLVVLLRNSDRVVSKEELIKAVWNDAASVSDDSLTQLIKTLRRSLGDHAAEPAFIATISGRGYRFVAPVQVVEPTTETAQTPEPLSTPVPRVEMPPPRDRRVWVASLFALGAAFAFASLVYNWVSATRADGAALPLHLSLDVPQGAILEAGPLLSPDGRMAAFVAGSATETRGRLWITDLGTGQARVLAGTEGATRPFWSPDSEALAFFAAGTLRVIPVAGGVSQPLLQTRSSGGGNWGANELLFSEGRSAVYAVSPAGGEATAVTALDVANQEVSHRWPQWLPDQEHFLYFIESANPERSGTYLGSRNGERKERLLDAPVIHTPGYLIYVRRRVLYAQRFDESALRPAGDPVALADNVAPPEVTTGATISVSRYGTLAYGGGPVTERFIWFDRSGRETSTVDAPAGLYNPSLSADQNALLAASGTEGGRRGVWLIDLKSGAQTRLTEGMRPLTSPDSAHIVFTTDRAKGISDIYMRALARENDELLVQSAENKVSNDWSPDGRYFVYVSFNPTTKWDMWLLPMFGERMARPFLQTAFNENQAQVSPSSGWIAHSSDETGRFEVYIQSFPIAGNKRAVSVGGGTEPHWRRDEREIFYLGPDRSLMSVDVLPGAPPQLGTPRVLFRVPVAREGMNLSHYDVSDDGQRFLVHAAPPGERTAPMKMLVNWTAALQP